MSKTPQSIIYLPLVAKDRVLGIITIQSFEKNAYTEHHLNVLQSLASYTAIALDNADGLPAAERAGARESGGCSRRRERARAVAEEADAAKSAFLSTVSHELRTPLTSVLGFAKIIKKRLEDRIFPLVQSDDTKVAADHRSRCEDNLKVVVSEGERLTKLIDDVLDLAKIEAGKLEWHMEAVTVGRHHRSRHRRHLVAVRAEGAAGRRRTSAPDLPEVTGDRDRLIQVVINLISNAVKFTDAGSVTCRAVRRGGELVVSVIDTGMGIAPGRPAQGVRALQAGRRHAHRQAEGHRPGPADLQGDRRAPRRPHLGRERARARAARSRSRCRCRSAPRPRWAPRRPGGPGRAHPAAARSGGRHHAALGRPAAAHPRRGRRGQHPRAADAGVHRGRLPACGTAVNGREAMRERPRASGPTSSSST